MSWFLSNINKFKTEIISIHLGFISCMFFFFYKDSVKCLEKRIHKAGWRRGVCAVWFRWLKNSSWQDEQPRNFMMFHSMTALWSKQRQDALLGKLGQTLWFVGNFLWLHLQLRSSVPKKEMMSWKFTLRSFINHYAERRDHFNGNSKGSGDSQRWR